MQSLIKITPLLAMNTLFFTCEGGSLLLPQSSASTCDATSLWAFHPEASGIATPNNNVIGASVNWNNQMCQIRSITSAFIEIYLDHARPSDLSWALALPDSSTPLALTTPANWNDIGSSCDSERDQFQKIDLLPTSSSTAIALENCILNVKDQTTDAVGTLIQWRFIIQGNS